MPDPFFQERKQAEEMFGARKKKEADKDKTFVPGMVPCLSVMPFVRLLCVDLLRKSCLLEVDKDLICRAWLF